LNFGYCAASLCFVEGGIPQRAAMIYLEFAAAKRGSVCGIILDLRDFTPNKSTRY